MTMNAPKEEYTMIMMDPKPALLAIAAALHGLAEALQYAAEKAVPVPIPLTVAPNDGNQPSAPDNSATALGKTKTGEGETGIGLAEIRALLAERCESGKEDEVRALITGFGADKLSQVDQRHYPALLQATEALSKAKEENPC